jgi:hypothetical protein
MTASTSPATIHPRRGLAVLLPDHHRRLRALTRELMSAAYADDPRALCERWVELETELLDHMAAEEDIVLPAYADHAPDDARAILADHVRLRDLTLALGVAIELHEITALQLAELEAALERHAAHEDAGMYPWAQLHLPEVAQHLLMARIGRWFEAA